MTKNEKGNILSFNFLIIFLITTLFLGVLVSKINQIKSTNEILKTYLCMKEATGELKQHNSVINTGNNIIHLANLGQVVGIITNPAIAASSKKIKIVTQKAQAIYHISFLKNISLLFKKGCLFSPSIAKTNYLTAKAVRLNRDQLGLVKKRKQNWKFYSVGKENAIQAKYLQGKSTPKSKEVIGFQVAKDLLNFSSPFQ